MTMFHVYVLLREKAGRLYVGSTDDVDRRLYQHNEGHSPSTRHGMLWRLMHVESFESRARAVWKERFFKISKGREDLRAILV